MPNSMTKNLVDHDKHETCYWPHGSASNEQISSKSWSHRSKPTYDFNKHKRLWDPNFRRLNLVFYPDQEEDQIQSNESDQTARTSDWKSFTSIDNSIHKSWMRVISQQETTASSNLNSESSDSQQNNYNSESGPGRWHVHGSAASQFSQSFDDSTNNIPLTYYQYYRIMQRKISNSYWKNPPSEREKAQEYMLEKLKNRFKRHRSGELSLSVTVQNDEGEDESVRISTDPILRRFTCKTEVLHPTTTTVSHEFLAGIVSGSLQVLLFNPYDRALYLSMVHQRPFFDKQNWGGFLELNKGIWPNLMQRIISYGMYFPIEQMWTRMLLPNEASDTETVLVAPVAGQLTGATSALFTNPLSLIKYRQYGRKTDVSLSHEIRKIFLMEFGLLRGLYATILRDSVFGCVFTTTRVLFANSDHQFFVNGFAGSFATIVSGPFNYARNQQYAFKGKKISDPEYPTIKKVLGELSNELWAGPEGWWRLWNVRLRIGWGSLRVGVGMACGNYFYRRLTEEQHDSDH